MTKKLSLTQVTDILSGEAEAPELWKNFFKGKRRESIRAWSVGVFFDDKEDEMVTAVKTNLTYGSFTRYCKKQGEIRVKIPASEQKKKKAKEKMDFLVSTVSGLDHHFTNAAIRRAEESLKKETSAKYLWLTLKDYEAFYAKGITHKADLVMPRFYEHFPNALRKLPEEAK